jgi:ribose transport system permease protein
MMVPEPKVEESVEMMGLEQDQDMSDIPEGRAWRRWARRFGNHWLGNGFWSKYGLVGALLLLILVFSVSTPGFATLENWKILGTGNSVPGLVALAALVPLMVGEFDLSVANVAELAAVLVAILIGQDHLAPLLAYIIVIIVAIAIGLVNGVLVGVFGLNSFIVTLAMSSVIEGISLYLTSGSTLFTGIPTSLINLGQGSVGWVPDLVIVLVVAAAVLWYLTEKTPVGRHVIAVGLGREAARLMGVRVRVMTVFAFVVASVLGAGAGVVWLGYTGSVAAGTGSYLLLPALTAGFLGATSIRVGRFNVAGTTVAVVLVAVGLSGLELNGAPSWVQPIFDGGVLMGAIVASRVALLRGGQR